MHTNRFSCCDLDGDGALSPEEMRHFYKNQILRVTNLVSACVPFHASTITPLTLLICVVITGTTTSENS